MRYNNLNNVLKTYNKQTKHGNKISKEEKKNPFFFCVCVCMEIPFGFGWIGKCYPKKEKKRKILISLSNLVYFC